jgi:putative nucleotidyltransferase with HDIG domain
MSEVEGGPVGLTDGGLFQLGAMSESFRPHGGISRAQALIFAGVLALALGLALFPIFPSELKVHEGDVASRTFRAPRDISFQSDVLTEKRREEAAAAVPDSVVFDPSVQTEELAKLDAVLGEVAGVRNSLALTPQNKSTALGRIANLNLSQRASSLILSFNDEQWTAVSDEARRVLSQVLSESVGEEAVDSARDRVRELVSQELGSDQALVVEELARPLVVANLRVDQARTEEARQAARAAIVPVQVSFTKNQVIVQSGDLVDATELEALREADLLSPGLRWDTGAAASIIALMAGAFLGAYLYLFQPPSVHSNRHLLMIILVVVVPVLVAKLYLPLIFPDDSRHFLAYMLPLAAAPILLAALLESQLAVVVVALLSALLTFTAVYLPDLSGVATTSPLDALRMVLVTGFGGLAGVFTVHRAERLNRQLVAGVAVAVMVMAVLMGVWLLDAERRTLDIPWMVAAAGVNGFLSAFIALGAFLGLAFLFGITTRVQLMELSQINQPLLRRLQEEAPGTFHHSIIVGNLAERAADAIGADSLLVRVGCYYHDVGKLLQPGFYVENQMGGENPHERLEPRVSAQIVSEHVHGGLELARKYRLPQRVAAFIPEHHGTRLVTYFYRKASQEKGEVDATDFTYPGPKPQTRETGLGMLADSVEATVRSSPDHSPERIDALVEEVITERAMEGQLDDCDLTLRDLKTIADSFKATLRGVYHPRLEYPEPTQAEKRRAVSLVRFPFHGATFPQESPGPLDIRRRPKGGRARDL